MAVFELGKGKGGSGKGRGVLTNPTSQVSIREDNSLSGQNQHVFHFRGETRMEKYTPSYEGHASNVGLSPATAAK